MEVPGVFEMFMIVPVIVRMVVAVIVIL